MKTAFSCLLLWAPALVMAGAQAVPAHSVSAHAPAVDAVSWVNPYIGTGDGPIGYGGMMPFVTPPFGMTNWTPQTRQNFISGVSYKYDDTKITGFIGTHQPAIWMGDYGYVTLMPETGPLATTPASRGMVFTHTDETVHPDYYSVKMTDASGRHVRTEITATEHSSYIRMTFPAGHTSRILVEASRPNIEGFAEVNESTHEITGYNPDRMDKHLSTIPLPNFKGYFVLQFRKPFHHAETYGLQGKGERGAWAEFDTREGEQIEVRVGTSFISIDQARANLKAEIPTWSFETVRQKLHATWNDKLARVQVTGASDDQKHMVYTAMYHSLLYPKVFSEQGRYYSAFDDTIHKGESYTAYSIWDTFRAENSMLTLLAPERIPGMITALLQNYKEGGWMPKWPNPSYTNIMIGTHADSLVAEAMVKHFKGFDYNLAWDAVYKDAMTPPDDDTHRLWKDREEHVPYEGRGGLTYYKQLGYIPTDTTAEAASRTLEDAYDDWCVAQVAKILGKTTDYEFFLARSKNYRKLYNKETGMMQGRLRNGAWADPNAGWTEGTPWEYTWMVLQDVPGLVDLMGGVDKYNAKLDQHFRDGHNVHKNEPSHHYGYLYDYSGQPWKTQAKVREIANAEYANLPSGLDGDDDCGQMSAWYLFTAFGFYPVNPASADYMIGSPLFTSMSMRLANGKTFRVNASGNSKANVYIQSARLNGKPLDKPVIRYDDIMQGATLDLVMGPKPSQWASH